MKLMLLKDKIEKMERAREDGKTWWWLLDDALKLINDEEIEKWIAEQRKRGEKRALEAAKRVVERVREILEKEDAPFEKTAKMAKAIEEYNAAVLLDQSCFYETLRLKLIDIIDRIEKAEE